MKTEKIIFMLCRRCGVLLPQYVPVLNLQSKAPEKMLSRCCPNCGTGLQRFVPKESETAKTQVQSVPQVSVATQDASASAPKKRRTKNLVGVQPKKVKAHAMST